MSLHTPGLDPALAEQTKRLYEGLKKALLDLLDEPASYGAIINACGALILEATIHDSPDEATLDARIDAFSDAMKKNRRATASLLAAQTSQMSPESPEEDAAFVRKAEAAKAAGAIVKPESVPESVIEARKDAFNEGLNQLLHRVGAYGDIPLHPREVVLKFFITGQILALTVGAPPSAVRKDFEALMESARRLVLEGNASKGAPS